MERIPSNIGQITLIFGPIHRVSEIPPTITINIGQKGGLIGHASVTQTPITLNLG